MPPGTSPAPRRWVPPQPPAVAPPLHSTPPVPAMNPMLLLRALSALTLPILGVGSAAARRRRAGSSAQATTAPDGAGPERSTDPAEAAGVDDDTASDSELAALRPGAGRAVPSRPRPGRRELRALRHRTQELREHDLRGVDLHGWTLVGVDLSGVDLSHAHLRRADLRDASLAGARLDYADLSGADLRGVDLSGVTFLETDLCGSDLRGVDLRTARQLSMASLRQVRHDRSTRWPAGFDPQLAIAPRL